MSIRIKLNRKFQDITELIPNFSQDTTYKIQVQSTSKVEFVESITKPEDDLPDNVSRTYVFQYQMAKYKAQGGEHLYARGSDVVDTFISIEE